MGFFILIIISVLFWWTLLRYSYSQKRVRTMTYEHWDEFPWIDEGRQKFPLWIYFVAALVSFVPIINIIIVFAVAILYLLQASGKDSNESYKLVDIRFVLRAPYLKWVKWLNKQI